MSHHVNTLLELTDSNIYPQHYMPRTTIVWSDCGPNWSTVLWVDEVNFSSYYLTDAGVIWAIFRIIPT